MKKFKYKHIGETLHHAVLDNGLNVFIVSKKGFSKTYSTFVTNFGASTTSFIPHGGSEFVDVPLGVAHFLEHKMFEMADGIDAMNHFDKMGA
ncbi:MAG: peptidase M16, partial [Bacilli bacterium]